MAVREASLSGGAGERLQRLGGGASASRASQLLLPDAWHNQPATMRDPAHRGQQLCILASWGSRMAASVSMLI